MELQQSTCQHRASGHPAVHPQRGQALILAVVCMLVLALALFAVFDTGQVVSKKEQLANAADAAAYSVGIEEARALNTIAYLNRAQVANQVAIAQLVSIQSYANYADSLIGRTSNLIYAVGLVVPVIGEGLMGVAETIRGIQDGYGGYVIGQDQVLGLIVTGLDKLNLIYSDMEKGVTLAFSAQAGLDTANKVVHDNTLDTDGSQAEIPALAQTLLGAQVTCFSTSLCGGTLPAVVASNKGYAERYQIPVNPDPYSHNRSWEGDRDADVMMAARDQFSTRRNGSISITPLPLFRIKATKLGGTDLVDYNRWVAVDDLTVSIKVGPCFLFSACLKWNALTMGLPGAAAAPSNFVFGAISPVFRPGVSLTQGSGTPSDYQPGMGSGWYSPYDHTLSQPYQGALGNVAAGADVAAHPADVGNHDFVADLSYLMGYDNPVPPEVTNANVVWVGHTHGLRDYNDTAPGKAIEPYATSASDTSDVGPVFTVYVQQADSTVRTGANIGMEGGELRLHNKGAGGDISALSSAQVYYDRPANLPFMRRADGNRELGNLFEPYWQVRLVPTPTSIKAFLDLTTVAGL